jgi:competence protein ComEA
MSSPSPRIAGALSRLVARVIGSRFAKPIARAALVAAGLVLLAVIGRASAAGALGFAAPVVGPDAAGAAPSPAGAAAMSAGPPPSPAPALALASPLASPLTAAPSGARSRASSDDPVILNTAAVDDLRRLPGIGQKRADAIVALRARMGRFRAVEDLMKVKGIGRAMLKRLRPLVRLDPAPFAPIAELAPADAGRPPLSPR